MAATFAVYVDWNNDGDFLDANETVTANVLARLSLHTVRGRDQVRALAPPMAGSLRAHLNNRSRLYSPENSSGALFGSLLPGRKVRVTATVGATTYTVWTGYLDDLPQLPGRADRSVEIPALGALSRLRGKSLYTALYESITTDVALGVILDAVGWPAADRVLDVGKTVLQYWWLTNEDAFTAARTLLHTEGPGAALYEDGQGRIVFESRHYRLLTSRSTTSQATFRDSGTEPRFSEPFAYNPGLKDVINVCTVEVTQRTLQALAVVWSNTATFTLAAGEVRKFRTSGSSPFKNAVTPVVGTDITVSAGSLASVTLDRTSGTQVTITLTAGSSGATITSLSLRAQELRPVGTTAVSNTVDTSASQAKYGVQSYALSVSAELDVNSAQDFCNAVVARYQEPRPSVEITLLGANDTRLAQQFGREISDRVTIVEAQSGMNAEAFVERISHEIRDGGKLPVTVLGCEKEAAPGASAGADYFVLNTSALDGGDVLGY